MEFTKHIKTSRGFGLSVGRTVVELIATGDLSIEEFSLPAAHAWTALLDAPAQNEVAPEPGVKTPELAIAACHHTVLAVNDAVLFRTELMGTPGRAYQLWVRSVDARGKLGPIVHLVGGKTAKQDHLYFPVDHHAKIQFSLPRTMFPDGRVHIQAHILDLKGGQKVLDLGETLL